MSDNHKITVSQPQAIQKETQTHPLVAIAIKHGTLDTQTMRELMTMQREYEADEARKAYTRAMVALKKELPSILPRDTIVKYNAVQYTHTSLGAAVSAVVPHLTKFGFSHSWIPSTESGKVRVTCRLTHAEGHHDETSIEAPPDNSGSKSASQAVASTITLLQRYTLLSLLGIATADMREPNGEDGGDGARVDMKRNIKALGRLESTGITKEQACEHVGKSVNEWTGVDLDKLFDLMQSKKQPPSPAPTDDAIETRRHEIYEMAKEAFQTDDPMVELTKAFANANTTFLKAPADILEQVRKELSITIDNRNK